jgi:hypothetical protein
MKLINVLAQTASILSIAALVTACGGGGGGATPPGSNPVTPPPATYTVGGTISGLTSTGLQLSLSGETISPAANAVDFRFAAKLEGGDAYSVSIAQQPTGQTCSLDSASGTISTSNVSLVLTCQLNPYYVGGSISGLTQDGLQLSLDSEILSIGASETSFDFATVLNIGDAYAVAIAQQPTGQTCSLDSASGTISTSNVSLALACQLNPYYVGGSISGLTQDGLQLSLDSEILSIGASETSFDFTTVLNIGDAYAVAVAQQPMGQTCSLDSASGTIGAANVTILLSCSGSPLFPAGTITGLTQGELTLNLNSGFATLSRSGGDNSFTFAQGIAPGSNFTLAIELPAAFADQPKAICSLDNPSGVAGTVDVENLNLVCRNLGAVSDLSTVGDQGLFAVDTDINASGQAFATALNITGGVNNYLTVDGTGGSWNAPVNAGSTDAVTVTPLGYHSSVLINNAGNDSLVYFGYSDLGGGSWDAQLSEKLSGAAGTTLPSNNTTTTASRMASASAILNGERVKFVAADNNDVDTPICIYLQKADGSTAEEFCITASADMKLGAGEVNSIAVAVHVNDDGLTGRGMVAWGQDATISTYNVSRVHAARFDLDSNNLVADVIAGGNTATAAYSFKKPAVAALSEDASDEFALSYQQDNLPPALLSVDSALTTSVIASVTDAWDERLAPELTVLSNGDLVWTYLGEDYSAGSILNGSFVTIWRARFDTNQAQDFSIDVNEARVIASEAGSLISHQSVAVDPVDNVLVSFRESVRSAAGGLGSPFGVGLEKERIRLFVLPFEGDYFSLTSSDGLVTEAVYDDDPNVGGDTRMPLDFAKDDAVLDVSVASSGEAVLAWSIWKDGATKNKALQAVSLELP